MTNPPGPIVVGGLGGSGTRVVARILRGCGVHLGSDLNDALDNLWFTLLFKRPRWAVEAIARRTDEIARGFSVLERAMLGRPRLSPDERAFVRRAVLEIAVFGHDARGAGRGLWPFLRALRLRRGSTLSADHLAWGWKEPNAHVFLPQLVERFADLRFVYVARHGLDMAYSRNRAQLENWGAMFGVARPARDEDVPAAMLAYWVAATRRACDVGRALGDRFLFLDFERLCAAPKDAVRRLADFAGTRLDDARLDALAELPRVPDSAGRYRREPWRALDPAHVDAVRELGFDVG